MNGVSWIEYCLVGVLFIGSLWFLWKKIRKNFSPSRFSKDKNCGNNCGCSGS